MLRNTIQAMKSVNGYTHDEQQYIQLIRDILTHGTWEEGRNGLTKSVFGSAMHFSLANHVMPILTTKKVAWKTCLKELLWFIRGSTDNQLLQQENVHIWDGNASREFLDSQGLFTNAPNDLGPVYGHQWRHFNAHYSTCHADYSAQGIDQLAHLITQLKNPATRTSRRLILSAWNPCQLSEMALPPCHVLMQFNVSEGNKLSCSMYQRSGDVGLGVPFNIASYCFLTHLLAHHCGLEAHEFIYYLGNCHIYDDHLLALSSQCQREPFLFPTLNMLCEPKPTIEEYTIADFEICNYLAHDVVKMPMRP